ncbi:hypothetical protein Mal48_27030 [Thalassoglobus polymorphus]|uniref:Uncharacterized protein n=1 Tax=Thalassoglobus polymorphus TaxID=2527994 RepID=A0A517QP75_9PLAN|nr:hypothetical protein Mal48_27030 [Thalassoglobus polymorphus]
MRLRKQFLSLEQFALLCAREERISLVKMLFATSQMLQTNSKDALAESKHLRDTGTLFRCLFLFAD